MLRKINLLMTALLLLLVSVSFAHAQVTGGAVSGSVVDAQGGVIPNATVTLTSRATGQKFSAQTTDSGSYNFPNVPVGDYTISITQTGFGEMTRELKVALNQTTTIDAALQAGGVSANVEVTTASEALVQPDNSQLSRSFDEQKVLNLPTFGDQNALALLAPNVVERSSGVQGAGGSVGGTRPRGNSFNVDGVDNNDPSVTGPSTVVIQDAVQEFTLLQNNFNAEFGAGAGGIFNTITKSGTNEFHGSGFLYVQSQKFNAASTLEEQQLRSGEITEKPLSKLARYGGTFGGPILKNKLFFFGAAQRTFTDAAATGAQFFAPTSAGLTQIAAIPGVSPFVVNLLRENLTLASSPTADATAQFGTVLGVAGIPFGSVVINTPSSATENLYQINIDHLPNSNNQFRYRFSYDRTRAEQAGGGNIKFNNLFAYDTRFFSANWVRSFSSNLVNDLRLSYRRVITDYPLKDDTLGDFPNITVNSLNLALGPNANLPQGSPVNNNYQIFDAVNYTRGNHNFKFGGEMRRLIFTSIFLPRARGDYWYSTLDVLLQDQPADLVNLRGVGGGNFVGNQYNWYAFGQDDWKVTPNLTLNLGLRYEYSTIPRDTALQELNAPASIPGALEFRKPRSDKNNFAPRVGLAYSPGGYKNWLGRALFGERGDSALRLNFSVSYYQNFQNLSLLSLPPQIQQEADGNVLGLGAPFLQNGAIPNVLQPVGTPAEARAATSAFIADPIAPYSLSWAFSYQRQLTPTTGLEVRYIGTRSHKLPVQVRADAGLVNDADLRLPTFFSQPTAAQLAGLPSMGTIASTSPTVFVNALAPFGFATFTVTGFPPVGNSQYDGGSISLTRRFSKGLGFTAAYTFSKTIDDSTNELNSSAHNPRRAENTFDLRNERGLSALDIPHRLAVSFNYELPFFNKSNNAFLKGALGGWEINGTFQAQSGQPVTIRSSVDSNMNVDAAGDRAIFNPNGTPGTSSAVCPLNSAGQFLAPNAAFFGPGAVTTDINQCGLGAYGPTNAVAYLVINPSAQFIDTGFLAKSSTGRNTFRTRGYNRTDVVLLKNIRFGEDRFNLQLGAEIFNLFNQRIRTLGGAPNGLPISGGVGDQTAAFSTAGNPSFNDYSLGNYGGRYIQMRAKFIF